MAELDRILKANSRRLITILGPGGMGKTRLAIESALMQLELFKDGVFFISLAPLDQLSAMVTVIAESVGLIFQAGNRSPQQQLLDYVQSKTCLLVLDNFEHLLDGAKLVAEILQIAPRVIIIATSREPLNIREEQLFHLEGLDFANKNTTLVAANNDGHSEAMSLILLEVNRLQPGFSPSSDDLEGLAKICNLVAGLPLGLILAATWVQALSPGDIAIELSQSIDLLNSNMQDLPERQRSIRAVFDHTWKLLSQNEQDVFRNLSIFRGGFMREAAQTVAEAKLPDVLSLVNKSILQRREPGRFEIHELLRLYGREKLEEAGRYETIKDAHAIYYLAWVTERETDLKGKRHLDATAEIEINKDNIRTAWQWAVEGRQFKQIDDALGGLILFFETNNYGLEGYEACELIIRLWSDLPEAQKTVGRALIRQGDFARRLGSNVKQVREDMEKGLSLLDRVESREPSVKAERAMALLKLGGLIWYEDAESARLHLEESLALSRALDDQWLVAWALRELSRTNWALGQIEKAKAYSQESVAIRRTLGNRQHLAASLRILSPQYLHSGDLDEAERLAQEIYDIYRADNDQTGLSGVSQLLSTIRWWQGDFVGALNLLERAWHITTDLNDSHHLNTLRWSLAETTLHLGKYESSLVWARDALKNAEEMGLMSHMGDATLKLGKLKLAKQEYEEALGFLEKSSSIYHQILQPMKLSDTLGPLCLAYLGLDNLELARDALVNFLQVGLNRRDFLVLQTALPVAALFLAKDGKVNEALGYYALALDYPHIANSRWFEDVVGQQLADHANVLPVEAVETAQMRGRSRDLEETAREILSVLDGMPNAQGPPINYPIGPNNLPSQTTPFFGRETELEELSRLLNQADTRLISILGPGGMGKTRLALGSGCPAARKF